MKKGGKGGANTKTGLVFEQQTDVCTLLKKIKGYSIKANNLEGNDIYYNKKLVAQSFPKHSFYRFLESKKIDYTKIISKKLLPDDALIVIVRDTLFIIEVKFQEVEGSVDEKLQTCDFKRKQYSKLVKPLKYKVEYVYVLNDWFDNPKYKDVLDYIDSVNCHYHFNEIPLKWLGLSEVK